MSVVSWIFVLPLGLMANLGGQAWAVWWPGYSQCITPSASLFFVLERPGDFRNGFGLHWVALGSYNRSGAVGANFIHDNKSISSETQRTACAAPHNRVPRLNACRLIATFGSSELAPLLCRTKLFAEGMATCVSVHSSESFQITVAPEEPHRKRLPSHPAYLSPVSNLCHNTRYKPSVLVEVEVPCLCEMFLVVFVDGT